VLGPLEVDGGVIALGPRDRAALEVLVLRHGVPVRAETVADALWGEHPPPSSAKVVQGCVVRLRKALGPTTISTTEGGYVLRLHHHEVDCLLFEDLVNRSRRLLADGQPDRARHLVEQALGLWRGDPFVDVAEWGAARAESVRLTEVRRDAQDVWAGSLLALGHHEEAVPELSVLVREEPTREHRWALLALAQYRSGRQGESLATLSRARGHLVDTLGLDPGPELGDLEGAVLRHDPALEAVPAVDATADRCPYPGLVPFETEDREVFFGRSPDVAASLRRLDEVGVLAIVGPSGCGKSSVLRAGVAASLLADGCAVTVITPGAHPLAALDGVSLGRGTVLVVDQCEEVFAAEPDEAREMLDRLVQHAQAGGRLALSIRADRIGDLSTHPDAARLVEGGLHLLGPLSERGLRQAIEGPAAQAGLRLEDGLVELLVQDVLGEPAALPLLSHVLRRTWELREGRTLTVVGYRATGGVRGAVGQTAEGLFRDLDHDDQLVLRELMTRLVGLGDHGDPVRQRVSRRTIDRDERRHEIVERLVAARLLSADGESVEIAHESLAVAWPRLRSWLDDDVDGQRTMRHLAVAAESWAALGRPTSELYRGVRQARAAEWSERALPTLTDAERDFLEASAGLAAEEQLATQQQVRREQVLNRRLRAGLVAAATLLVLAVAAGGLAVSSSRQAEAEALGADARRLGAEALRAKDTDTALLLAVAGATLHDSTDTRANLLAALDQTPDLMRTTRVPRTTMVAVDPRSGDLLVAAPEAGLLVHDANTLAPLASHAALPGPAVVSGLSGGGAVATVMSALVGTTAGGRPAVVLVDADGADAARQLGGIPASRFAQQDITVSANGRWLAVTLRHESGSEADVVGVWDLTRPDQPVALLALGIHVQSPTVTDDGRTLLSLGDGELLVTDLPGGAPRRLVTGGDLAARDLGGSVSVSPDGRTVAVSAAGEVVLADLPDLTPRAHLAELTGVDDLTFSPDGSRLAVGGPEAVVWDLTGDDPVEVLRQEGAGGKVAFSRDGQTLYSAVFDGSLMAWDLSGREGFLRSEAVPDGPLPFMPLVSPDGTRVLHVEATPDAALAIRDIATGAVSERVVADLDSTVWLGSAWSPDSSLVTMSTGDDTVAVWEAATGREVARTALPPGEGTSISAFGRDGTTLLVGTTTGRLHVLDPRTLRPVAEPLVVLPDGTSATSDTDPAVLALEPGPDGLVLATLEAGSMIVDHRSRRVERLGVEVELFGAGWSPDGLRLLLTTREGAVGLLDADTRTWISPPSTAQPFAGWSVVFSRDGSQVATFASGRVGRWDGRTGAFLGAVGVPDAAAVGFTGDGRGLRVAESSGRVRTWDLDPAAWRAAACRMAGRPLTEEEWRSHLPTRPFQPVCGEPS